MTLTAIHLSFEQLSGRSKPIVKTCGMMRVEHAVAAAVHGADVVGLVFAPSKRTVTLELAASVRAALNGLSRRPLLAGVFVNESTQAMLSIAAQVGLDVLQLSGDETPEQVAECAARYPVLKALRYSPGTPLHEAIADLRPYRHLVPGHSLRFLVDTHHPGNYGGTGKLASWPIAAELARHEQILLAGGLTPANVAQAIAEVTPWGVDVSSGIERNSTKDSALIEAFIDHAQ